MNRKVIVKIDLCGSKDYVDTHMDYEGDIREKLLHQLYESVTGIFPYSDKPYPDGSIYSAQGDCIYIILEKPTVAMRCTVQFMKTWYGKVPSLPDCRAVIDYGDISETQKIGKLEILGEPFENISKMEKHFAAGQIGVTEIITEKSDSTLFQYVRLVTIDVSVKRQINTYLVNYEDPRLIHYTSLAHALFIADPSGALVRDRAMEALLIESLKESERNSLSLEEFTHRLKTKNLPEPSPIQLNKIINNSKYIDYDSDGNICWDRDNQHNIDALHDQFDISKKNAINFISSEIAEQIGISSDELQLKLNISQLTEEYLCAVFLQIRMMANYFRSTGTLFQRLSEYRDFDYIVAKHFKMVAPNRQEEILLFRRAFLESLKELSQQNNLYIASIFHNVFLLYYLNRNSQLSRGQLANIKEKDIYLDANTFYSYVCKASPFHIMLRFTVDRLIKLGSRILFFDASLIEYLNSLESTVRKYRQHRQHEFTAGGPWIWKEFISDVTRYRHDFEFCVSLHKYPKQKAEKDDFYHLAKEELKDLNITLEHLEPFFSREELGELFRIVYELKLKYDPSIQLSIPKIAPELYEGIVLHDANCLRHLEHHALNPYYAKKLFVTCDFLLAKIRKKVQNRYEYLITVPEFYEFMLPYLFMGDAMVKQPIEMPNFLLASFLYKELLETQEFSELFGNYLAKNIDRLEEFKILEELSTTKRYQDIQKRYEELSRSSSVDLEDKQREFLHDSAELLAEYSNKVRESLAKSIVQEKLELQEREIRTLEKKIGEIEDKLKILTEKDRKRRKYYKREERKKKQNR